MSPRIREDLKSSLSHLFPNPSKRPYPSQSHLFPTMLCETMWPTAVHNLEFVARSRTMRRNFVTFIKCLALSRAPGGVGGLDWIVWIGCLGSKRLDLCARGKAWMTRAGDHGRKGARAGDHGRKGCLSLSHGREGWLGLSHGREEWLGLSNGKKRGS